MLRASRVGALFCGALFSMSHYSCSAKRAASVQEDHIENKTAGSFDNLVARILKPRYGKLQSQPDLVYDPGDDAQTQARAAASTRCTPSFSSKENPRMLSRGADCTKLAILLHGFGACPGVWYFLQDELHAQGFCVLRPTLPGHGLAPLKIDQMRHLSVRFDQHTVRLELSFDWVQPHKSGGSLVDLGLKVEDAHLWLSDGDFGKPGGFHVTEVIKGGMVFKYNTAVARRLVATLDMLMVGDRIREDSLGKQAELQMSGGRLYLHLPLHDVPNALSFFQTQSLDLPMERHWLKDDMSAMPTSDTWDLYDDFAIALSNVATAFKLEGGSEVVIMGHSLGAAMAADVVVHAPRSHIFDRILLLNPAFGLNPNFDFLVSTFGNWLDLSKNNDACERTRYTLSTGGFCQIKTQNANGVREFGSYAYCRFLEAAGQSAGWSCGSVLKRKGITPGVLPAGKIEVITTFLDAAIDNNRVNQVASYAQEKMGDDKVGFCYLKGELTHNFLNELSSTSGRPFWWHETLTIYIIDYLVNGKFFPLKSNAAVEAEGNWVSSSLGYAGEAVNLLLLGMPRLLGGVVNKLSHTDFRCDFDNYRNFRL